MNANELMVGDWVLINKSPDSPYYKQFGIEDFETDKYQYCEPIPLTREILEKNGFIGDKNVCKTKVRDDSKDELWQCEYAWYLKNLRIKNRTNGSVARLYNIMFVHELQHALRLCGIDKVITI